SCSASIARPDWWRPVFWNPRDRPAHPELGSNGQSRHSKIVDAGGVAAGDLGLFLFGYPGQDLRQDLARSGKRRLALRVVGAPHHILDADDVAQPNADRVLLKAQHDVAAEKVARQQPALKTVKRLAMTLAICVIHRREDVGRPRQFELDDGQR